MKLKYILVLIISTSIFRIVSFTGANIVQFTPLYYDYMSGDTLPASCESMVNVHGDFSFQEQPVEEISFLIKYNPEQVTITNIAKTQTENMRSRIEDDHLVFTQRGNINREESQKFFSLFFHTLSGVENTSFSLDKNNSHILYEDGTLTPLSGQSETLHFVPVQQCTPDVTPPLVKLLQPDPTNVPIDTPIILEITDKQSNINRDATQINIDNIDYTVNDDSVQQEKNRLTIDPIIDFSYGTSVNINIRTQDTASFPASNDIEKTFTIFTTANTPACQDLGCPTSLGRQITDKECVYMQKIYLNTDKVGKYVIRRLFNDLSLQCSFENIILQSGNIHQQSAKYQQQTHVKNVGLNLLSVFGWVLFLLTLGLKFRYKHKYHKEKKKRT